MFVWPAISDERTACHMTQACDNCQVTGDQSLRMRKRDLTFFWFVVWRWAWVRFPLFTVSTKYFLECSTCRHQKKVPSAEAEAMRHGAAVASARHAGSGAMAYDPAGPGVMPSEPPYTPPPAPPYTPPGAPWTPPPGADPWS
jgi:hypothetical protein